VDPATQNRALRAGSAGCLVIPGAKEAGIDGVPCFIFGGSVIVTGAQSPEYLANAIARGRYTRMPA
jgi:uncharacterized membrane protein